MDSFNTNGVEPDMISYSYQPIYNDPAKVVVFKKCGDQIQMLGVFPADKYQDAIESDSVSRDCKAIESSQQDKDSMTIKRKILAEQRRKEKGD